ncbi:transcription termination factor MTERF8, chloroplastic [Typha latifolia]|uniref:transcription termination factor MTERF8, chloroplastic n=1 Tax=Typha latifolia TaxID=4733 RepID=UPI003C2AD169
MASISLPPSFTPTKTLTPPLPPPPPSSTRHWISSSPLYSNQNLLHLTPLCCRGRRRRAPITPSAANTTSIPPLELLLNRELNLDEREAEAFTQKLPRLDVSSQESLLRRIKTLQSTGLAAVSLRRVVLRRLDLLASWEIDPFLEFVQEDLAGLKPAKIERLLLSASVQTLSCFASRVTLLLDHEVPRERLVHVVNNVDVRKVFVEMPVRQLEELILYLKRFGWPEIIVRRPSLLNLDLESQLIPRVEFLIDLSNGNEEATAALIRKLPAILSYTVEHFKSHLEFWTSVGLTGEELFKIAAVYPNVFSVSKERKLKPRVEFLKQCGLDAEDVFKFLVKAPLFLSLSFLENLSKKLAFLVKIGYKHRTKDLAFAVGATTRTSCENMQMVVVLFFSFGLSCEDVLSMSKKHPQVLQYNHESLRKKMEFLIEGMDREVGELLMFPAFLGYNLDKRIKYRYEMKKDIRGKGMSLNKLLSVSSDRFYLKKSSTDAESSCEL